MLTEAPPVAVEIRGLVKSYGRVRAVDNLSMSVPRGSIFGLLGHNGAGKSTTFGVLCGWLRADSGTSVVLGVPSAKAASLRGRVVALPQDASFAPEMPIVRQLMHYARLQGVSASDAEAAAIRALSRVGLQDAARKRGAHLSHGMAKRAGIAQCLIGRPELVLLDEPTAGLDPGSARQVRDLIEELGASATVIVSSHNLGEIEDVCTHGAILVNGRLRQAGTIRELTQATRSIVISIEGDIALALAATTNLWPNGRVDHEAQALRLSPPAEVELTAATSQALEALLAAGLGITHLQRGQSLEDAFLSITEAGR